MTTADNPALQEKAKKRKYNSPLREQQLADTRERIICAGAELVHSLPSWDWTNLTAKAVSERAGVSERTVHRHFASEQNLRDEVVKRLIEESGVKLENLKLNEFHEVAADVVSYLSSFAAKMELSTDPAQAKIDSERKQALLDAVAKEIPEWQVGEQKMVAAMLDMLWDPSTLERLKTAWGFDSEATARATSWLVTLVQEALANGRRP